MGLGAPLSDYRNKQLFTNMKKNKQPYDVTKKIATDEPNGPHYPLDRL